MSIVSTLVLGGLALLLAAGALVSAARTVARVHRLRDVVHADATPITAVQDRTDGLFAASVGGADADGERRSLAAVTDTVGYWCLHSWATGARTNGYTQLGHLLLRLRYGDADGRRDPDRRRATLLSPSPLPVRAAGERTRLALGEDGHPLQRLEADGEAVPFLLCALPFFVLAVGLLVLPVVAFFLPTLLSWAASTPLVWAVLAGYALAVGVVKVGHDTALVGDWDAVVSPSDDAVPEDVRAASDTADPPGTARACVRDVAPGERLWILGRVEADGETVRVVDGVVTACGRRFLTLAAGVSVLRGLVWTLGLAALTVGIAALLLAPM
ncbi:hypothetical protein [Halarchaeum sp. P4]|uniref:hypothetical protein n=1 Tax=Halarchaeum sp. P4 TaxID=3421639 RepID=UPI003EBE5FB3